MPGTTGVGGPKSPPSMGSHMLAGPQILSIHAEAKHGGIAGRVGQHRQWKTKGWIRELSCLEGNRGWAAGGHTPSHLPTSSAHTGSALGALVLPQEHCFQLPPRLHPWVVWAGPDGFAWLCPALFLQVRLAPSPAGGWKQTPLLGSVSISAPLPGSSRAIGPGHRAVQLWDLLLLLQRADGEDGKETAFLLIKRKKKAIMHGGKKKSFLPSSRAGGSAWPSAQRDVPTCHRSALSTGDEAMRGAMAASLLGAAEPFAFPPSPKT